MNHIDDQLNCRITCEEILQGIRNLKKNKTCGEDRVINEYIKSTSNLFVHIYEELFNLIFDTGILPDVWLLGNIKPIYKNKGNPLDPKNFRPITILSCLGKLFTSILNERLRKFSEEALLLNENQFGFRKSYSTTDSIFSLFSFFEILKTKKKKLFCAFVDFEKAFDTVWREALWYKLLLSKISGKMFNVILNMYKNVKSCVTYNNCKSDYFSCDIGVRQGENLSPFLFAIFLNDLQDFLESNNINGLETLSESFEEHIDIFLKLFVLLYADDTALMAESASDLQNMLDKFGQYCEDWNSKVNVNKTKIMIFSKGRPPTNLFFSLNGSNIEIVNEFLPRCSFKQNWKF